MVERLDTQVDYVVLAKMGIFRPTQFAAPIAQSILDTVGRGPTSIGDIAREVGLNLPLTTELVSRLAKMNLVRFYR